jgi:hypothetical protein
MKENRDRKNEGTERGEAIVEWLAENDMVTMNTGEATHTNRSTGNTSAPDIAIAHSSQLDRLHWKVIDDMASDHKPIIITYTPESHIPSVNDTPRYKWRLGKADWGKFQEDLEDMIPSREKYEKKNVNKLEKKMRKWIKISANKNIGKKKVDSGSKAWMTDEIKEKIKARNRLRKDFAQNKDKWIEACREVAEMIRAEKERRWKEFVEEIDRKTSVKDTWRTIRNLDGRHAPRKDNEVLVVDGKGIVEDKDKAHQFKKTYKMQSRIPREKSDKQIKHNNRSFLKEKPDTIEPCEQDLKMEEFERVLKETSDNKAAGIDDAPYELLKHMGPKAKTLILFIYNMIWRGGEIPQKWRTALIKPLLKDGKDRR